MTTPQEAAAEVAERAGTMASMMHQRVVGVVENMSFLACPHCGPIPPARDVRQRRRRAGGGDAVRAGSATTYPLLGRIPLEESLREGGDAGKPIVDSDPTAGAAAGADRGGRPARPAAAAVWQDAARPDPDQ